MRKLREKHNAEKMGIGRICKRKESNKQTKEVLGMSQRDWWEQDVSSHFLDGF
jgi:hypothetical protein